ncbi:hypothetical protein AAW12_05050 [Sphingobacterium sp. Ag1]|uniref:hypothetical protein n=1 Tax=Sphingobacterium sp. Ag1 TaxID=1643451 RepID=UPI0006280E29|nr:hypothetical protein [Sphingobacterium sp. Ag1]KKO92469.1 hypothetical protein AAW12_05050 [Sphingobacterium sp. Ag1]
MKSIKFILIILYAMINSVYAQDKGKIDNYKKFENSFLRNFKYPAQLQERCIPVLTLMVISFDQTGKINSLHFSDSAYPQFIEEFRRIQDNIDFESLYMDLKSLGKVNEKIIIPIQIDTGVIDECESGILQFDLINLYLFDNKPLKGKYFLYKKILSKIMTARAIS